MSVKDPKALCRIVAKVLRLKIGNKREKRQQNMPTRSTSCLFMFNHFCCCNRIPFHEKSICKPDISFRLALVGSLVEQTAERAKCSQICKDMNF